MPAAAPGADRRIVVDHSALSGRRPRLDAARSSSTGACAIDARRLTSDARQRTDDIIASLEQALQRTWRADRDPGHRHGRHSGKQRPGERQEQRLTECKADLVEAPNLGAAGGEPAPDGHERNAKRQQCGDGEQQQAG
jgi:hypothetical protein